MMLDNAPYLQIAIDANLEVITHLPRSKKIMIELGTPLIKAHGLRRLVDKVREKRPNDYIVADMKTLDVGGMEAKIVENADANAIVVSALASVATIREALIVAKNRGIDVFLDSMNVLPCRLEDILKVLDVKPQVIVLHRSIDVENTSDKERVGWENISELKGITGGLIAVAGGITPQETPQALDAGADIIVVGRFIYQNHDPRRAVEMFLEVLQSE